MRLWIVGRPFDERTGDELRERCGSDGRIVCRPGFVPDGAVQTYMNACDAVVLPYRDILTSGAAVLAMSFGRACVAPRIGCLPDLLGCDANRPYDAHDPDGLAGAMNDAISRRQQLEAMGRINRERIAPWTWDRMGDMTCDIYRACLRDSHGGST